MSTSLAPNSASKMILLGATSILGYNLAKAFPDSIIPYIPWPSQEPTVKNWPVMRLDCKDWIEALLTKHDLKTLVYCHAVCDISKCEANQDSNKPFYVLNIYLISPVRICLTLRNVTDSMAINKCF